MKLSAIDLLNTKKRIVEEIFLEVNSIKPGFNQTLRYITQPEIKNE